MKTLLALLLGCLVIMGQDFSGLEVRKVASGHTFTEGPVWSPKGYLLYSDVREAKIWRLEPGKKPELFREHSNGANGNAIDGRGRLYSCEVHARRLTRTDEFGNISVLMAAWEGKRLNATNDIVIRRDGHVYFTDPAFGQREQGRELGFYAVYHLTPDLQAGIVAKPKGRPNGIGLSPDGRILYVANTDEERLYAYDLDDGGRASNERAAVEKVNGRPDGIAVDALGNIYVAADGVPVYSPAGKLLHVIEVPEKPTNCAFGGDDLQTLYITAQTSVYAVHLKVKGALHY